MNLVNLNIRHSIKNRLLIEFKYETETVIVDNLFLDGKTHQELMDWQKKLNEAPPTPPVVEEVKVEPEAEVKEEKGLWDKVTSWF